MVWPEKFEEKVMGFKFNPQTRKINFRLSSGKIKDYYSLTKINSMDELNDYIQNYSDMTFNEYKKIKSIRDESK